MNFAQQEFRAEARFQRVSPQKARLVLDLIKGRRVGEALETLMFTNKGVAPSIEKLLRSAIARHAVAAFPSETIKPSD